MIPNDLIRAGENISPSAFRVYCVLAHFNPAFPSYKKLMELSGLKSRATIAKVLKELTIKGLVDVRRNDCGKSNNYECLGPESWMLNATPKPLWDDVSPNNGVGSKNELITQGGYMMEFNNCTTPSSINEHQVVQKMNTNKTKVNNTHLTRLSDPLCKNRLTQSVVKECDKGNHYDATYYDDVLYYNDKRNHYDTMYCNLTRGIDYDMVYNDAVTGQKTTQCDRYNAGGREKMTQDDDSKASHKVIMGLGGHVHDDGNANEELLPFDKKKYAKPKKGPDDWYEAQKEKKREADKRAYQRKKERDKEMASSSPKKRKGPGIDQNISHKAKKLYKAFSEVMRKSGYSCHNEIRSSQTKDAKGMIGDLGLEQAKELMTYIVENWEFLRDHWDEFVPSGRALSEDPRFDEMTVEWRYATCKKIKEGRWTLESIRKSKKESSKSLDTHRRSTKLPMEEL